MKPFTHGVLRSRRLPTVVLVACLVAAGCGGDGATAGDQALPAADEDSAGEPQSGGSVEFILTSEALTLDPLMLRASATGSYLSQAYAIFGALATAKIGDENVQPGIAESVTTDDGGTTWTVELRPDVVFSDGTSFNAAAVVAHWERIANPENRSPGYRVVAGLASYTATDDLTVTVELPEPNVLWDRQLAGSNLSYVPSPTAVEAMGEDFGNAPVGAGPFVVESWTRNDKLVLQRNDSYWDAPRPYVDTLVIRAMPDEDQALNTYRAGDADLNYTITGADAAQAGENETVYASQQLSGSGLAFNVTRPPFDDPTMRQAVAMGLDIPRINEVVYEQDDPPRSMFQPDSPFYREDADFPEQDVDAATALVEKFAEAGGDTTIPLATLATPLQQTLAAVLQAQLSEIGIDLVIESIDTATLIQKLQDQDYSMTVSAFLGTYPDPVLYETYHTGASGNWTGYSNPNVDALLEDVRTVEDPVERIGYFQDIAAQLAIDMPYVPIRYSTYYLLGQPWVHGIEAFEDVALRSDLIWVEQ